jgi:hypothetical protein
MNDILVKHLKALVAKIESGESNVKEISTSDHYTPVLNGETGEFIHQYTGDLMIIIRCKNNCERSISVSDLD